jgi:hypothetical protein
MLVSLLSPSPLLSMFGRNVWEKVSLVSLPVGLPHRNAKQQSGQGLEGRWIKVWHFDLAGSMRALRLHCKLRQKGGGMTKPAISQTGPTRESILSRVHNEGEN